MRHHRPLHHPLESLFARSAQSLTTALSEGTRRLYEGTFRNFLSYLAAHHPEVSRLKQLQRDPHTLGWLAALRSHTPPFATVTIAIRVTFLYRMLQDLAWSQQIPTLAHLLTRVDVPRRDKCSPRPLLPEQDQLIQQELQHRDDFLSNLLLLQRHTGMRIGECVDLTLDCLFPLAQDRWAIHVPLGKLKTERWVPVDAAVRQIVDRLRALRPPSTSTSDPFLLPRNRARETLIRRLRAAFRNVVSAVGITTRLVPHQNRHTYATEMLRSGVSFPAVMQLLGHTSPEMTLRYLEITQPDLQREYHQALSHPRHLVPSPPTMPPSCSGRADLPTLLIAIEAAQYILQMLSRTLPDGSHRRLLTRVGRRLSKIRTQLRSLSAVQK